ncbi:MAG: DUF5693 family protein [bacterium]
MGKNILIIILTVAVLLGGYLGFKRFMVEQASRQVEIVVDLKGLKKIANLEKRPLAQILKKVKELGITELGIYEETLTIAAAKGEIQYKNSTEFKTNIQVNNSQNYERLINQLRLVLGNNGVRPVGNNVIQINEAEEELRELGLGITAAEKNDLEQKGFSLVPRILNDPRYNKTNIRQKIETIGKHDLVIFDGEDILGSPDALPELAAAMKTNKIKYGFVEIVKQKGDQKLKKLMQGETFRVHSVPKDELKKITKEEALDRFCRAARERGVKVFYLRPFLPPELKGPVVDYNLQYFGEVKGKLEKAGFVVGKVAPETKLQVRTWQIICLGLGVVVSGSFLLNLFVPLSTSLMFLALMVAAVMMALISANGGTLLLQKLLAFSAGVIFPAYAVTSTFSVKREGWNGVRFILNILAETFIGIFIMVGLLADYRFMSGTYVFPGVKLVLILPVLIVAGYFLLQQGKGKLLDYLNSKVTIMSVLVGAVALGALGILVARSGNFVLPVPGFEKTFRNWLEVLLFIRPRTKEFLIGYPFIYLAAVHYLRGEKTWLWLLAAVGVIAPISVFNTFSHIHTPILVSLIRTFNGLILGLIFGALASWLYQKYSQK